MSGFDWTVDTSPNWKPLEDALSPAECADFMHMGRTGSVEHYKHRDLRTYLHIDAGTGTFMTSTGYRYTEISRATALAQLRRDP